MKKALLITTITIVLVLACSAMASAASTAGYGPMLYNIINGNVFYPNPGVGPGPGAGELQNGAANTSSDSDNMGVDNLGNPIQVNPYIPGSTMFDPQNVRGGAVDPVDTLSDQWEYYSDGEAGGYLFTGFATSTHPQGTWNSPYMEGVDGYNYNDPQDYVDDDNGFVGLSEMMGYGMGMPAGSLGSNGGQASSEPGEQWWVLDSDPITPGNQPAGSAWGFMWNTGTEPDMWFPVYPANMNGDGLPGDLGMDGDEIFAASTPGDHGPHGNFLTTTHKCRECHAVHRAAGKFKLTRADTRMEACDWCHGTGAGSGFNIQMDNNDNMTREYDVGHSLGFGLSSGKWKAPDDTDPAYTPKFYMGGFSCFDCHSPHANKQRTLGYIDNNRAMPSSQNPQIAGIVVNSGATDMGTTVPWPLTNQASINDPAYKIIYPAGKWILLENPDANEGVDDEVAGTSLSGGPINKIPISWNMPFGSADEYEMIGGSSYFNMASCFGNNMSEFCTDCHDGNAGLHTQQASMFSEDRALRSQASPYDIGYSHDAQPRH